MSFLFKVLVKKRGCVEECLERLKKMDDVGIAILKFQQQFTGERIREERKKKDRRGSQKPFLSSVEALIFPTSNDSEGLIWCKYIPAARTQPGMGTPLTAVSHFFFPSLPLTHIPISYVSRKRVTIVEPIMWLVATHACAEVWLRS